MKTLRAMQGTLLLGLLLSFTLASAKDPTAQPSREGLQPAAIGVTRHGVPIECLVSESDSDFFTTRTRILLIGGAGGDGGSAEAIGRMLPWFHSDQAAAEHRRHYSLSSVSLLARRGGAAAPADGAVVDLSRGFPPPGPFYGTTTDPEAAYLWRWIGLHAPDLVVEVRTGESRRWDVAPDPAEPLRALARQLSADASSLTNDALVAQLPRTAPADVGTIPALRMTTTRGDAVDALMALLTAAEQVGFRGPSPARRELQRRIDRSPLEIRKELLDHYGRELTQPVYIESLAVMERLRFVRDTSTSPTAGVAELEQLLDAYYRGTQVPKLDNGSALAGHLLFCDFAEAVAPERRGRYLELARAAADLAFDADGKVKEAMPFHNEMSDAVFMGGPILARVGQLTGEARYFDACAGHLRFMRSMLLRPDGIYRHSPLDEAAWGRGNGFPALGLALCLSAFPEHHPARPELLKAFREHLAALAKHQDATGCWHQVIDRPESYREFTATCMITFAMARGVRRGWLEAEPYRPLIDRGWTAVKTRIGPAGELVDVCTGTGKQQSLRDYYDRTAILGRDPRGGAMALLVASEIERWQTDQNTASDARVSR